MSDVGWVARYSTRPSQLAFPARDRRGTRGTWSTTCTHPDTISPALHRPHSTVTSQLGNPKDWHLIRSGPP